MSTKPVQGDLFFSGCAYLDTNGDKQIDPQDPPLEGARFTATVQGGAGFGARTGTSGCGLITIPVSSLEDIEKLYPVTLKMLAPEEGEYVIIGASEFTLQAPDQRAEFLFQMR